MPRPDLDLTASPLPINERTLGFAYEEYREVHGGSPSQIVITSDQGDALAQSYHDTIVRYIKDRKIKPVGKFRGTRIVTA